ncbi:hypothetical protein GCM10010400_62800 [Streptomyces aculeolatus]
MPLWLEERLGDGVGPASGVGTSAIFWAGSAMVPGALGYLLTRRAAADAEGVARERHRSPTPERGGPPPPPPTEAEAAHAESEQPPKDPRQRATHRRSTHDQGLTT